MLEPVIDRRLLLRLGTFGLSALALPGAAHAAFGARGFTHNVASGEPAARSVLLWTRFVAANDTSLTAELSEVADFGRIAGGGSVIARGEADHTAKLVVEGLAPNRWYYYRFVAPDGQVSPVGRTRTLPEDRTDRFNLALFSCSNLRFGWFNAYAHAAARSDIDCVLHVGDYLYEYNDKTYPDPVVALPGRVVQPSKEIVALADYRLRHASYRADPDLQRLHQAFPMIAQWDDHELTNDAWRDGAQNHQTDEGDWPLRKTAAMRAYREWLPVSDTPYRSYQIGDLATLILPESRAIGRDKQPSYADILTGSTDPARSLAAFRDTSWRDPARSMLGIEQEVWMTDQFKASTRSRTQWQILPQQVLLGKLFSPLETGNWLSPAAPDFVKQRAATGVAAARAGLPSNFDAWDGYPAARDRLLKSALDADANLVALTGDTHNAWAFDLALGRTRAGVEFGGHSVTSPGLEGYLPGASNAVRVAGLRAASRQLKWAETERRGYMTIAIDRNRVMGTWHFLDTIRQRSAALSSEHRMSVVRGSNRLS